jgi:hypothetical protein
MVDGVGLGQWGLGGRGPELVHEVELLGQKIKNFCSLICGSEVCAHYFGKKCLVQQVM